MDRDVPPLRKLSNQHFSLFPAWLPSSFSRPWYRGWPFRYGEGLELSLSRLPNKIVNQTPCGQGRGPFIIDRGLEHTKTGGGNRPRSHARTKILDSAKLEKEFGRSQRASSKTMEQWTNPSLIFIHSLWFVVAYLPQDGLWKRSLFGAWSPHLALNDPLSPNEHVHLERWTAPALGFVDSLRITLESTAPKCTLHRLPYSSYPLAHRNPRLALRVYPSW